MLDFATMRVINETISAISFRIKDVKEGKLVEEFIIAFSDLFDETFEDIERKRIEDVLSNINEEDLALYVRQTLYHIDYEEYKLTYK